MGLGWKDRISGWSKTHGGVPNGWLKKFIVVWILVQLLVPLRHHLIAGLTGESWLVWLDRDLPVPYFHTEGGKSLLALPYRDPDGDFSDVDISALLAAVRMRLATRVGGES